jgi:hypothetical protein
MKPNDASTDGVKPLIRLTDSLIVAADQIIRADRCGNYTDVWLRGYPVLKQIWDEDMRLWDAIKECSR